MKTFTVVRDNRWEKFSRIIRTEQVR